MDMYMSDETKSTKIKKIIQVSITNNAKNSVRWKKENT